MIPKRKKHNTVIVAPYRGSGAYGPVFGESVTYVGLVDSERKLVRNSAGEEVISSSSVYLDLVQVPEGSKVTVWPGTDNEYISSVVAVQRWQAGRLSHTVLSLA